MAFGTGKSKWKQAWILCKRIQPKIAHNFKAHVGLDIHLMPTYGEAKILPFSGMAEHRSKTVPCSYLSSEALSCRNVDKAE